MDDTRSTLHHSSLGSSLRTAAGLVDELVHYHSENEFLRQAAELVSTKIGAERCVIFTEDNHEFQNVYASQSADDLIDRYVQGFKRDAWIKRLTELESENADWIVLEDAHDPGTASEQIGWIAVTPIRSAQKLIGVLVNDAGITNSPINREIQEVITAFCAFLAIVLEQHQDITDRKLAEEALRKAHDELEERVGTRTTELSTANDLLRREISERQQAQEELNTERNLLRILIDNLPQYIYIKDLQSRFLVSNRTCAHLMGANSPEELLGKTDFDFYPHASAAQYHAAERYILESGLPQLNTDEVHNDEQGNLIWVLTSKFPLKNSRGEVTGLVGFGINITERKQAEEALRRAHDQLEQRVEERTAELRAANDEVRRFAYIVSHDLRAPLVNIKGFSGELQFALKNIQDSIQLGLTCLDERPREELMRTLQEDVPEALSFISASVERMDYLINAILKLSRLGRRHLQLEDINTTELVGEIIRSLGHQIAEHRATVIIGSLPNVMADRIAIEQIIGNILANAVLYLDPARPGQIEITGETRQNETVFHISDNGWGIAEENYGKVFEPFRRAGKHTVPGEGMGLAYVQTLVRRHEGRIWFDSELNTGTTFSFSISHQLTQEVSNA